MQGPFCRLFVSATLLIGMAAQAQTGAGSVKGTVYDASRAAVAGARITLTNQATNISRDAESSAGGIYNLAAVPPGSYKLVVEAPGFKKWLGNFLLEVGHTAVVDPVLEVGSVETVVEVAGVAPVITTEGMAVADVKDALRIHQLPLNGRAITNLFVLTPGVEGADPGSPRVNGLKVGSLEMLLDGVSVVDRFGGGMSRVQPGLDTIQEFRIETTGSSAQYSRPATVTLVTKSGTNALHGGVFETHRNNRGGLRARTRQDGNIPSKLIRNEFGASAGGPVRLPWLYDGRDKSFWFFAYEGLRNRQQRFQLDVVPTAAMWDGDFSQIIDTSGRRTTIYDPLTTDASGLRQAFPGNIIPRARLHPFYGVMKSISHLPTRDVNPYQGQNLAEFYPDLVNTDTITLKGDHRFSGQDSVSGTFSRSRRNAQLFGGRFGSPPLGVSDAFGTGRSDSRTYTTSLRHTHIFSPRLLNELLLAGHRSPHGSGTLADFTNWPDRLGMPNPFGVTGWPTMGAGIFAWDADNRHDQNLTAYIVEDNATWNKGKHSMKFGGKVRFEYNNVRELQQAQGSHSFGGAWTSLYNPAGDQAVSFTGDGLASMALGLPTSLSDQFNRGFFYFQQKELGFYFHDSWKVTPRLTLELGLRWDKWTAYREKYNRLVNADLNRFTEKFEVITPGNTRMEDLTGVPPAVLASWARRGLTWTTARQAGFPDNLVPADNNNFGPRLGAAYRLTDKTVLRAGFGEYFWTMPLAQILQTSRTNPPLNLRFTNPLGSLDGTGSFGLRTRPRPEFFVGQAGVDIAGIITIPPSAQSLMPWDVRDWRDSRAQSWHFTVEREIMRDTALRLTYVGDHGRDLEQRFSIGAREAEFNYQARTGRLAPANRDLLRANPNWSFRAANHTGYSNTHSLQAEVERRYSNGLAFQWFYTFTRSLTTTDAGGFTSGNGSINAIDGQLETPERIQLLGAPDLSYDQLLRLSYYNSTQIPAQRIRWNGIYDLPFGRGRHFGRNTSGALDFLIGGWQIATIGDWRGGLWQSVVNTRYLFGDPTLKESERLLLTFAGLPRRLWFAGDFNPSLASNVSQEALQRLVALDPRQRVLRQLGPNADNRLPQLLANGSTVATPITDTLNWNARAFYRGPGAWNSDIAVFKNFRITENARARLSADFFNVFNHPVDGNPNATTGLQDLSVQANDGSGNAAGPRIIQFSLRFEW